MSRNAALPGLVESIGHKMAQKMSWPSIAANAISGGDNSAYCWMQASEAQREGLTLCSDCPTEKSFHTAFLCILSL